MKKLFALGMAAALSLSLLAGCSTGTATVPSDTPSDTNEETDVITSTAPNGGDETDGALQLVEDGKLIMATNAQFPPYEMVADGEGAYDGFEGIDVEIAKAIADKLGLELVIDDMEFDSALMAVQNNAADVVLAGLSYSEDRDEVMDFTEKYATGVQVVIVKEGSEVNMDNLGDYLIGTQRGTTGYIYASDTPENGGYGEDHVIAYDNGATAVQALMNGQVDAVIIDQAPAEEFVAANTGLTILPGNWVEEDYCIAVDEGNTSLLNAVQGALSELQADGTVDTIIAKYIKAE
ncbi:amino acid ABC transporter substrate-binding protein [Pseudoflavonifractor phocaeensis]|uniref:ABC transporter substrate-binding protein n=1 Tax=Pseudoflavonifractor phocaeensis TaxID=1870988 RepID=UPI00195D5F7A|nr:ABC transporter substrate-binding protein [Pseudoflavonifractor phocaeensis]MBM6869820.1 amino acid ABC transporter substrate-binding protein [Pseudoflavonifractor phocaeensis]MBM6938063.1 amino acid ABC transporter substrate-binding protein [Pseudoflavonifractor phocaeensis]